MADEPEAPPRSWPPSSQGEYPRVPPLSSVLPDIIDLPEQPDGPVGPDQGLPGGPSLPDQGLPGEPGAPEPEPEPTPEPEPLAKPPWNPAMSQGCVLPYWLRAQLGIIDRQIVACHPACIAHDQAYYLGTPGDETARARADHTLERTVAPIVGVAWAGQWVQAIRLTGAPNFGMGRTWDGRPLA